MRVSRSLRFSVMIFVASVRPDSSSRRTSQQYLAVASDAVCWLAQQLLQGHWHLRYWCLQREGSSL
jgi:hypothetical protein